MNITTRLALGLTVAFLMSIIVLELKNELTFGCGLGDIFYLILSGIGIVVAAVVCYLTRQSNFAERKAFGWGIIAACLFTVYMFGRWLTVDRGPEYKWDGYVFLSKSRAVQKQQRELEQNRRITPADSVDQSY